MTKTTDGKSNFLYFLVSTIQKKFPENLKLSQDLETIPLAAKGRKLFINYNFKILQFRLKTLNTIIYQNYELYIIHSNNFNELYSFYSHFNGLVEIHILLFQLNTNILNYSY